jgi:hypothetical protein
MPRSSFFSYALIVRLLTMSIVWLLLLIWFLNAYRANCGVSLLVLAMFSGFMLLAGIERSFLHRRALFNECLHDDNRLFDMFYNHILMTLREIGYALVLGVLLMVGTLVFEPRQWSILFIDLLLLSLLIPRLVNAMSHQVRDEYRYAMARQWATWLSLLLLWGEAVTALLISPPEYYVGMRWQEVVTYGVTQPEVACPLVADAAQIYAVGLALAMWSVQNASRVLNDPTQAVMAWIGFSTLFGLTFAMALAFSRALVGVMGRPWEQWRRPVKQPPAKPSETATPNAPRAVTNAAQP